MLGEMIKQLVQRRPFYSPRVDCKRRKKITPAVVENDCQNHKADAEPDRPPVLFQIQLSPAHAADFLRFTAFVPCILCFSHNKTSLDWLNFYDCRHGFQSIAEMKTQCAGHLMIYPGWSQETERCTGLFFAINNNHQNFNVVLKIAPEFQTEPLSRAPADCDSVSKA